jgi:hypothetical protein
MLNISQFTSPKPPFFSIFLDPRPYNSQGQAPPTTSNFFFYHDLSSPTDGSGTIQLEPNEILGQE